MFMYEDQSETNEVDVIHIRNVHKEDGTTMVNESLLFKKNTHCKR